ncbi:MAG: flagellin [Caulobacteraceae bacterium]|nr:flagellin [Caulobacteraceae bacterium]
MSISVNNNSNNAARIALQDLANTQGQLTQTQNTVSSGLSVASAQDNPDLWSIAQNQQQSATGLDAVTQSLNRATSISDVATAAGQNVLTLLNKLKNDATSASDPSLDATSRQAYNADFKTVLNQISNTVNNATFDGANLLNGSSTGNLSVLASADGSSFLTLSSTDLSLGGSVITLGSTASLGTASAASTALSQINSSLTNVTTALSNLGVQADQISAHTAFVSQLSDSLQTGVGDLVNANMGAESAKLQALQVQQQLSVQSLSVANQAPSVILSLFR